MDPDLLLAIALSQSLMEKEVSPTTVDNSTHETQDSLKLLSLENVKETDYLQVYFEKLVDALRKDVLHEHLSLLPPLSKLLVDGPSHFTNDQIDFLSHFLKFVSTCIKISELAKYSPDGVELIGVTCRGILKFVVEAIEHLCNYKQSTKVYKQQVTTMKDLLFIIDLLCTIDQSLHSTGPTLRTEFKLSTFPRFSEEHIIAPSSKSGEITTTESSSSSFSSSSSSNSTTSPTPSAPQGLMALIASPPHAATAVSKTKEEGESDADIKVLEDALSRFMRFDEPRESGHSSRLSNLSMDDMLKRFEEYFEKELTGVSRLLRASSNFVLPTSMLNIDPSSPSPVVPIATALVIESKTQLNDLLDRLEFTQKVLELLASTHLLPCDRYKITDAHAAPWLFHSCVSLLALHRAEENFYRKTQAPKQASDSDASSSSNQDDDPEPCLIERSMMDDIIYIAEKLSDSEAERSIQVTLVLGIMGSFNELSATTFNPSSIPAIPAFNPDLVELALQVAKSILNPLQSHSETQQKDRSTWNFSKEKQGPIVQVGLSQGRGQPELVLDASRGHSWENAVQYVLNGPIMLDSLFYLLVVTFAQSGKTTDSAPLTQEKRIEEVLRPSAMETDTDVAPDEDNIFGALFAETRPTSFKGEPTRSETVYIDSKYDDDALDLAKNIVDFLGGALFSLPVHEPLVRKQVSTTHVDALIYIASNGHGLQTLTKPPLEDPVFLEGFRRVAHHITTSGYLSANLQEHLVHSILSLTSLSRECVHLLARLLVARRATAKAAAGTDDILILEMWDRYFKASESVALEYLELLLLAYYMLHDTGKHKVLTGAFGALSSLTSGLAASNNKSQLTLSIASLVLTLNYILCNPTSPSSDLVSALDYHIFSTSEVKAKEKRIESPVTQQPSAKDHHYIKYLYSLPSISTSKQDQIFTTMSAHANYDTTYKLLCDILNFGPSGDIVLDDYLFYTVWQLLQQLPPSAQFLESLKDQNMFQAKPTNSMLIALYWLIKIATGVIPHGADSKSISEIPIYQHYMTCASLLPKIAEKASFELEGQRVYSILYSLVQFASVPFRAEPALPESQAGPLASAFTHGASSVLRSISQEYRQRVIAHVKLQQQQQQQRGHQQLPATPLPPMSHSPLVSSPPPPPPPPPSKHLLPAVASSAPSSTAAQTPLDDTTMGLIADLSKAGAPSVVLNSLLPYPSHSSVALLSPGSISAVGSLSPLAPAITPLFHTTTGELSVQSLLTYILTVCVVVIHHAKDASDSKGLVAALMDIVHDSLFGFAESTITPLFAALVSAKQDREVILGTALAGHIVELAVAHATEPVAVTYTVDTLRSPLRNLHLATYFLPPTAETPALVSCLTRRGLEVWLEVLRGVQEEMTNQEVVGLMCDLALQDPRLREGFAKDMTSLDRDALSSWLQEKLLGRKSGSVVFAPPVQESVIRFLYILAFGADIHSSLASLKMDINPPPPTQFEFELFDQLLGLLRVAFDTYFQNAKEYFVFLQVLAVHTNQLPKLMQAVIAMLPEIQPYFTSQQQKALSVTSVWTQFLSTILAHCKKVILEHSQPTPMHVEKSVEKKEDKKDDEKERAKEIEEKEMEAIAGKCCTYAQTGNNYTEQHWYFCYTCKLMGSNGCCTVCARVCHRGHDIGYSRFSRFFCDCGASTNTQCKSLKPIKYKPSRSSSHSKEQASTSKKPSRTPHVLKMVEEATEALSSSAPELPVAALLPQPIIASLLGVVSKESLVETLFPLLNQLLQILKQDTVEKVPMEDISIKRDLFTETKKLDTSVDVFSLKRSIKAGAFDVKLAETRDNRKITRRALDSNSRRRVAVGEQDRVIIAQLPKLLEDLPATASSVPAPPPPPSPTSSSPPPPPPPAYVQIDKSTIKTHAVAAVGFEVMSVSFNPSNESYLAVCGPRDCRVLTLNSRDEVVDQLSVELALEGGNTVLRSAWLPGSQVKIGIIASQCVKVYDLARDALSPLYYFTLLEDTVRDAVFAQRNGAATMLLISATGMLFAQPLGSLQDGPCIITDTLFVPPHLSGTNGASLYFSQELDLLFATYADGKCVALRLNTTFTEVLGGFIVSPSSPPPSKTATAPTVAPIAPHTSWVELESVPGSLVALSYASPLARAQAPLVGVSITMDEVRLQGLKPSSTTSSKSGPRVEGLTVVGGKRQSVLILLDDGSLHRYDPIVFAEPEVKREIEGEAVATPVSAAKPPPVPRSKSSSKKEVAQPPPPKPTASSSPPIFPLDFFEKVECITPNIQFGGDALATNTSDAIHQKLGSNEEYLASTSTDSFTLTVTNPFPYTVMVGVRILLGAASLQHIPKEIRVFDRVIKTHESVRRWFDIPFTQAESISAEHEFSVVFSGTHSGASNPPIVDSVEVYGMSKEDFGWDSVLAQNAANSQPMHDPQSVAKMSSAEIALYYTLSALHHYLLLAPPPLPNIDEMKQGLPLPSSPPATATAALLSRLPVLLNDPLLPTPLRNLVKSLLLALCHNHPARYSELKDAIQLRYVAEVMVALTTKSSSTPSVVLEHCLRTLCRVSRHRPSHLAVCVRLVGSSFSAALLKLTQITTTPSGALAPIQEKTASALVEILFTYIVMTWEKDSKASTAAMRDLSEVLAASPQSAATSLCTRITDAQQQFTTGSDTEMQDASAHVQSSHDSNADQTVEYQCDSCQNIILDQRWHCNECADYDLCDKCHKNNAESATHTTAHAMTNHSIGPSSQSSITLADDDYAMQEAPEDEELEKAIALSMVESPLTAQSSEQSVVPVGPPKPLSTPSTVLERLLEVVLDQFKSMRGRGGMATIPYLQVVHVLTKKLSVNGLPPARLVLRIVQVLMPQQLSARASPAAEEDYLSLVLFWILLGKAKKVPTSDGAASTHAYANVVNMLIHDTKLMDKLYGVASELLQQFKRNSKHGEASSSTSTTTEARVPGALLTERSATTVVPSAPSSTPFNASPFFSETFARSHKDLFHNFPKILSEVVMRLVLAVYSCAGKQEQSTMQKEQWEQLLCNFIQTDHASFVHKHCKRLLLSLTGHRESYYLLRDKAFLSSSIRKVLSITQDISTTDMTYEQSVKLVECLQKIEETINLRPHNWLLFCTENPSISTKKDVVEKPIVPFLLGIVFYLREEAALLVLKLLVSLFADDKSSKKSQSSKKETPRSSSSEETLSPELVEQLEKARKAQVTVLLQNKFTQLVNVCLLEYNSSAIRLEARNLIHKMWQYAEWEQKVTIFQVISPFVVQAPSYGSNAGEFMELLTYVTLQLQQTPTQEARDLVVNLVNLIAPVFHTQNKVLANHPNSYLYRTLGSLVDVEGYYLESEPCLVCNDPELHFVNARLETLKSEMKFTDKTHLIKFNSTYTIASLNLHISDIKKTKMVRTVNIYHTNKVVGDLGELRNKWALWKKVRTFTLQPEQSDTSVSLPICVNANNLLIEYAEFYENLSVMASEKLQCPRCSRTVTDKHGICKHCHENAFQCRQCRNINYENLHAFLCNECGYCKYAKFEYSLAVKPSYAADKIESEEDHKKTQQTIEKESEAATKNAQQLAAYRRPLVRLVAMLHDRDATPREEKDKPKEKEDKKEKGDKEEKGGDSSNLLSTITISASDSQTLSLARVNKRVALLALLYGKECKSVFENLSKAVQVMLAAKRELIRYMSKGRSKPQGQEARSRPANRCYGCSIACVTQILTLASHLLAANTVPIPPSPSSPSPSLVHEALVKGGVVEGILNCTMYQGDSRVRSGARGVLCAVSKDSEPTTNMVMERIKTKIMYGLDNHLIVDLATTVYNEVLLLKEISSVDDKFWDQRLKLVLEIFFFTLQNLSHNPVVAEHVVLPLLRVLVTICVPSLATVKEEKPKEVVKESRRRVDDKIKEAKDKLALFGLLGKPPGSSSRHTAPPQPPSSSTVPNSPPLPQSPVASSPMFEDTPTLAYTQWASGAPSSEASMAYDEWASKFGNSLIHPATKSELPAHEQRLARKYALRWRQRMASRKAGGEEMEDEGDLLDVLISNSWLKSLLFHTSSISIRAETAVLVEELSKGSPQRRLRMLDLMTQLLESAGEVGETSTEFFTLYKKLVEPEDRKLYLTVKGFLPYICALISKEIDRIVKLENAYTTDTSQGFVLMTTISLLASFLNVPTIRAKFKRDDQLYHSEEDSKKGKRDKRNEHHLLERVLDAFLSLRGIILNKTKFIDDSVNLLQGLLKLVNSESYEDNQMFMAACIKALDNHEEGRTPIFIFEQLCNIVKPPRAEPVYMLTLNKMPSQEEFIRGGMTKNPYTSTDVGPLMRDVKNKICRTLDLRGLLDDDNGMELLVHSKIIKLDLPVAKVYEHVWRRGVNPDNPTAEAGPMQVVYRLQGLDGEATEEIVDKIVTPLNEANQIDPEEEYKITAIMTKCGGLHAMKRFLNKIQDFGGADKELANLVLRLLFYSCKLKVNRLGMIELGMMDVLLDKVRLVFGKEDLADAAEMMLLIIESIVEQMYIIEDTKMYVDNKDESIQGHSDNAISQMAMFLDNLASPLVRNNTKVTKTLTRIIPYLTYGNESVMKVIVNYLIPYLNFEDYDANHANSAQQTLYLEAFVAMFDSIRKDAAGLRLKSLILESGSVEIMVKYLVSHFPNSKPTESFAESMQNAALPYVLSLLTGLCRFHVPTQLALHTSQVVIPSVHTMEGMVTVAKVPALAENLLEALRSESPEVAAHVDDIRNTTKAEKIKQAEQHRMGVLKSLGLLQSDGGKITANVVPKSIEELEEDTGLTCMVCREGYSYKPNEVLGLYTFSKRVPLSWLGSLAGSPSHSSHTRAENGYTTVTHFNVIHFSCHRDATKAERGLKVPKEEWEGAALRNQQTKCNAIFPLSGPKVSDDSFIAHMDKFWAYLTNVGRVETARFRVLTHDIKFAMLRFAREESFSTDSKGGGKESNIRAIPFFIAGGLAMLDQRSNPQRAAYEKTFSTFATQTQDTWNSSHSLSDNILYMLVLSLFVQSGQQWQTIRLSFLKRLLGFAGVEYRTTRAKEEATTPATPPTPSSPSSPSHSSSSSSSSTPEEVFKACRPLLIFFTFIDQIQNILKPATQTKSSSTTTTTTTTTTSTTTTISTSAATSSPQTTNNEWVSHLMGQVRANPVKLQNDFRELLSIFEDELTVYESFMEFADFLGLLPAIMTETPDCNEFMLKYTGPQNQ